jgi:acyl-homoserine-lactone acylase
MKVKLFALLLAQSIACSGQQKDSYPKPIDPLEVTIARDSWGVAHIFGKTDSHVAYGLAWANAEDNFATMQELYMAGKGMYGQYKGMDAVVYDYAFKAFKIKELVDSLYERDISLNFRNYLDAFVQGVNDYAVKHPDEILLKALFPMTGKDIIAAHCIALAQEQGVGSAVSWILNNRADTVDWKSFQSVGASNGVAISKRITDNGNSFLLVNPHQPIEGFGSIYEAHLCSEEGLNMHGGVWNGALTPSLGANEYLGWMTTTNALDMVDVFQLEMKDEKTLQYRFDGQWVALEGFDIKLNVKVFAGIKIGVKRKGYWSKYGATFKNEKGYFSVRAGSLMRVTPAEQLYKMNKATSLEEFKKAIEYFPIENFIYADRKDSIYLVNNGLVPKRNPNYDWRKMLPGNTSKTLWTDFHGIEEMVNYTNPRAGYLYNTNNSAFYATDSTESHKLKDYPSYFSDRYNGQNNRALRVDELIKEFGEKISFDEFRKLKYDVQLPKQSKSLTFLDDISLLDTIKYADLSSQINLLRKWDRLTNAESEGAGLFLLTTWYFYQNKGLTSFFDKKSYSESDYIEALRFSKKHLLKYFKTTQVKLGDLLRYRRGKVDLPLSGYPDVMAAIIPAMEKDGRLKFDRGDGFFMFAQFSENGVSIETSQAFGSSSKSGSKHYTDQMEMYNHRKTKRMTLNKNEILKTAVRVYSPQ